MLRLQRAYFWFALAALTCVSLVLSWPYLLWAAVFGQDPAGAARRGIWRYGRIFTLLLRPLCPQHVANPDQASRLGPCIITPNHQSFLDIYLLGCQSAQNLCFVVGKWPFRKLFFFALMMYKAGYIRVGRTLDEFDFVNACAETLRNGATLVCFPEGTRSRTGELGDFHPGIFRVAAETGTPVVPMVFHDSGRVCPPGRFAVNPRPLHITLLPAMQAPTDLPARKAGRILKQNVHEAMRHCLETFHPSS